MSPELLERIDKTRGLVPRATYIEHCLRQYLDLQNSGKDEMKFYDEILAMLPEEEKLPKVASKESYDKLRITVKNVRMKILNRKEKLLPK